MPKKRKKLTERTSVLSILFLVAVSSTLTFIRPGLGIFYQNDIYVILGMITGSYFVVKREVIFKNKVKHLLILTFIGGIIIGADITSIMSLIYYSQGAAFDSPRTYLFLLTGLIIITQLIIALIIIGFYYIKEKDYFGSSNEKKIIKI